MAAELSYEHKRTEEALQQSEGRVGAAQRELLFTIDTIPALAWSARLDGSAELFNQHYIDYVGLPLEQLQDWGWSVAVHPDDLPEVVRKWEAFRASGTAGEGEARLRRH